MTLDPLSVAVPHPMVIVTVAAGGERDGCLVGFHTRCSVDPARYLVCLSVANLTREIAGEAASMIVHFPRVEDAALAKLFGEETGYEIDKFARCSWEPGPGGAPLLRDVQVWFAGRIVDCIDLGDHDGFVLEPFGGRVMQRPFEALHSGHTASFEAGRPADPERGGAQHGPISRKQNRGG